MTSPNENEGERSATSAASGLAVLRCFSPPAVVTLAIILFLISLIVALVMGANVPLTLTAAAALVSLLFLGAELSLRSGLAASTNESSYSSESIGVARQRLFAIVGEQLLAMALTGLIVSAGVIYFTTRSEKEQQLREDRQRFLAYVEQISTNQAGSLESVQYVDFDLSGMRAHGLQIEKINLTDSVLDQVEFKDATFVDTTLNRVEGNGTNFDRSSAVRLSVKEADLEEASFRGAITAGINFEASRLKDVDFTMAILMEARFVGADMDRVDFSGANLSGATFHGATMKSIIWDGACWSADNPPSGSDELPAASNGQPDEATNSCPPVNQGGDS